MSEPIPSIKKCPKCGANVRVVDWNYVECTNPECEHSQKSNLIYDGDIFHP